MSATINEIAEVSVKYEIRIADAKDRSAIVKFIDEHWRKDHVFVKDNQLLDWQHFDKSLLQYNFVIAVARETKEVHGLLGFIPLNQFDHKIERSRLCWMAIWKVREDARGYKLGRHLMTFLDDQIRPIIFSTVAASAMTLPMYEARGFQVGTLSQYFILNPLKESYRLIRLNGFVKTGIASEPLVGSVCEVTSESELDRFDGLFQSQVEVPRKSPTYFANRYLRHPSYRYRIFSIRRGQNATGLVVIRRCTALSACALRVIDFVGSSSALRGLGDFWLSLLQEYDAEYVDFYNAGISDDDLRASGFTKRKPELQIVIPSYFEPFERKNVEISYVIRIPKESPYRIVKGDSDQDRPNTWKEQLDA